MKLKPSCYRCIWCDCEFSEDPRSEKARSEEHIVPKCIGGTLITTDVCRGCNGNLGGAVDHYLNHAQTIMEAGREAGIPDSHLLPTNYAAHAETTSGTPVQITIRGEQSTVRPNLGPTDTPFIASTDGKIDPNQKTGLALSLARKAASTKLPKEETRRRTEELLANAVSNPLPGATHFDAQLGLGIKIEEVSPTIFPNLTPRKAIPAVLKILYETLKLYSPPNVTRHHSDVARAIRNAILRPEQFPLPGGLLHEETLPSPACCEHEIGVEIVRASNVHVYVCFFSKIRYSIRWSVVRNRSTVYFRTDAQRQRMPVKFAP